MARVRTALVYGAGNLFIADKGNNGVRKVPTLEVAGRYFACSPFDPEELALELDLPLDL